MPWINLPRFERWPPEKKAKWILGVWLRSKMCVEIKTRLDGKSFYFKRG